MGSPTVSVAMYPKLADGEFAFYRSVAELAGTKGFGTEFLKKVLSRVDVGDYYLKGIPDLVWTAGLNLWGPEIRASLEAHGEPLNLHSYMMTLKMAALKEAADNEQRL